MLKLYANPFHALDHEGKPCGAYPDDPSPELGFGRSFVGASINVKLEKKAPKGSRQDNLFSGSFEFAEGEGPLGLALVERPETHFYKVAVRGGALIAADAETASKCGIAEFESPLEVLKAEAAKAAAAFKAETGKSVSFELTNKTAAKAADGGAK